MALLFKCKERVIKIRNYHLINEAKGQIQYALIISLFFNKVGKRLKKEKTCRINIYMVLFDSSDGNDIDMLLKMEGILGGLVMVVVCYVVMIYE